VFRVAERGLEARSAEVDAVAIRTRPNLGIDARRADGGIMSRSASAGRAGRKPAEAPGAARRAVAAVVVATLFAGGVVPTPVYDLYRGEYGLSELSLTLLYAVYAVGNLTALLFFARLADQVGRRPIVLASLALTAAAAGLFAAAASPPWLFAARMLSGFSIGLGVGAAAAWMTEFTPARRRDAASDRVTLANFLGLAAAPVAAAVLVQYAPWPMRLPYLAYLGVLALAAAAAARARETLRERAPLSLRPRLGVPRGARLRFVAPAVTQFAAMAVVGLYASVTPDIVRRDLGVPNRALGGAVVALLFVIGAVAIAASRRLSPRRTMLAGLAAAPPGLALLVAAQQQGSIALMLAATALCGVGAGLGYSGGLEVTNRLAPAERRAEAVSAFFISGFLGGTVPILGVGAVTDAVGPAAAVQAFAAVVAALALGAFATDLVVGRRAASG
jgi:MFS family permease